ncbi:NADP-dependent oxidoreductase [Pedobacter sp. SYP-B3415]|uniref:NADP-dependent oxidoreductase n=1 Tax=Pedobacter sp. SYP-B3415 TaxID=2496641 RepID=UPI00101C57BE|nr:NADP-dependent oxidoreductase [Pedobacter sp. SYP-B3415]
MKAIILNAPGGTENFEMRDVPKPTPGEGEVLIRTVAVSINPIDWKTRQGKGAWQRISQEQPVILGWDVSGVIESVGPGVHDFSVGDAVFGMVNFPGHGRTYAEYVLAPSNQLAKKPQNISHAEAAASTLAALTAWDVLFTHAGLQAGQKVLIHAAAGGVGHFAVQFAHHAGAYVIGTSSAEKRDFVLGLGAQEHIDYKNEDFSSLVQDADLVVDTIGGEVFERSLKTIRPGGQIITIPTGYVDDPAGKAANAGIRGQHITVKSSGENQRAIANLLEEGKVRAHIDKDYPVSEIAKAHEELEKGNTTGKIVLHFG